MHLLLSAKPIEMASFRNEFLGRCLDHLYSYSVHLGQEF